MRIPCPHCGSRSSEEFAYLGDATPDRPADDAPEADWFAFVYLRDNPAGPLHELWHHVLGCRSWIVIERDTVTHEVRGSVTARDYKRGKRPT